MADTNGNYPVVIDKMDSKNATHAGYVYRESSSNIVVGIDGYVKDSRILTNSSGRTFSKNFDFNISPSSHTLNETSKQALLKYNDFLQKRAVADKELKDLCHSIGIPSSDNISAMIKSASVRGYKEDSPTVKKLKELDKQRQLSSSGLSKAQQEALEKHAEEYGLPSGLLNSETLKELPNLLNRDKAATELKEFAEQNTSCEWKKENESAGLTSLQKNKANIVNQLANYNKELADISNKMSAIEKENNVGSGGINSSITDKLEKEFAKASADLNKFNGSELLKIKEAERIDFSIKQKDLQIEANKIEIDRLKTTSPSSTDPIAEQVKINDRINQLKRENSILQKEITDLQKSKTNINNILKQYNDLTKAYNDAAGKMTRAAEYSKYKKDKETLTENIKKLNDKSKELDKEIKDFEGYVQAAKDCIKDTQEEINKKKKELEKAQKKVDDYEKKKKEAEVKEENAKINQEQKQNDVVPQVNGAHSLFGDSIIDIEGKTRYSASPYGRRVGYTALSCGNYSVNSYNSWNLVELNSKHENFTATNQITFILPLPDGAINLDTSVTWNEDSEDGLNEAAHKLIKGGGTGENSGVFAAGLSKAAGAKALSALNDAGMKGALRGTGLAYNPNKQMYFEGVEMSTYEYSFNLVPKSREEANQIKIIAEAINILMLPGTTQAGNNAYALKELSNALLKSDNKDILSSIVTGIAGGALKGLEKLFGGTGSTNGLNSPFFSYPGLWTIGFYVTRNNKADYKILEYTRLAMTSCKLEFGSDNVTWHDDGFPTVMKLSLGFTETQYRTKENMWDLVAMLGNVGEPSDTHTLLSKEIDDINKAEARANADILKADVEAGFQQHRQEQQQQQTPPTQQ